MRIQCLQHASFEQPDRIEDWARRRGHRFSITHLYTDEPIPQPESFDLLLVMGGPMSVHDEGTIPWLRTEKLLVRRAIDGGKAVLGV